MVTKAPVPEAAAGKAVYAPVEFLKFGEGASKNFGFAKHLTIGLTLGVGLGFLWKTWHWNEKRYIAQFYSDLAKREAREEAERQKEIQAKYKALEEELLS